MTPHSRATIRQPDGGLDVPLTVWPCGFTEPAIRPVAALAERLPADRFDLILAGRLVAAFSDHRDTVVDLTAPGPDDPATAVAVPVAAAVLHRRCTSLTHTAHTPDRAALLSTALTGTQSDRVLLHPTPVEAAGVLDRDTTGPAGLIVARHPRPDSPPAEYAADALAATAAGLLAARGVLAVILADPPPGCPYLDHASGMVRAAADHGLGYAQHVIALRAPIRDGRLVAAPGTGTAPPAGGVHRRVHTDVLIFR